MNFMESMFANRCNLKGICGQVSRLPETARHGLCPKNMIVFVVERPLTCLVLQSISATIRLGRILARINLMEQLQCLHDAFEC